MSPARPSSRAPRAFRPDDPKVTVRETAPDEPDAAGAPDDLPAPAGRAVSVSPRAIKWGSLFAGAAGGLIALAGGIWLAGLAEAMLARRDWIGWLALALLTLAGVAAVMIALKEFWALFRLRRLGRLRKDLYRQRPETAWGRARLAEHEGDIMDARELLTLAERELVAPLDIQARAVVTGAAKRIAVLTAVSPAAVLDMVIVAAQNLRMLRRLAAVYGARPGALGLVRLVRMVVAHIVFTGGVAMSDDLIQQMIGHGLTARLSARLGEGLFNGALTARIGLAAMDVCRPMPFIEAGRPRLRDLVAEVARQTVAGARGSGVSSGSGSR